MPLNVSELGLNCRPISNLYGVCLLINSLSCVHSLYAGKKCNGNPISNFPPCYAFQMIFTALAPKLIQSISRNVRNRKIALKRLWYIWTDIATLWKNQPRADFLKIGKGKGKGKGVTKWLTFFLLMWIICFVPKFIREGWKTLYFTKSG